MANFQFGPLTPSLAQTSDLARIGGKGASLARMVSAGFPVPLGFTVAMAAYLQFLKENELEGQIGRSGQGLRSDGLCGDGRGLGEHPEDNPRGLDDP